MSAEQAPSEARRWVFPPASLCACPACHSTVARLLDRGPIHLRGRLVASVRRRECSQCGHTWTVPAIAAWRIVDGAVILQPLPGGRTMCAIAPHGSAVESST